MSRSMTKGEIASLAQRMFEALGEGKSDNDVMRELGLPGDEYQELKGAMFRVKAEELKRKPPEQVYCEYILAQMANIHDLSDMISQFRRSNQYSAMVGAVRARADILDRIIDRGQEFDLVVRKPEEKRIVAGVLVANLSNEQLKTAIVRELGNMNRLMKGVAEGSITELDPGNLYEGAPQLPEVVNVRDVPKGKGARTKTNKVIGGGRRKMVAPPLEDGTHDDGR